MVFFQLALLKYLSGEKGGSVPPKKSVVTATETQPWTSPSGIVWHTPATTSKAGQEQPAKAVDANYRPATVESTGRSVEPDAPPESEQPRKPNPAETMPNPEMAASVQPSKEQLEQPTETETSPEVETQSDVPIGNNLLSFLQSDGQEEDESKSTEVETPQPVETAVPSDTPIELAPLPLCPSGHPMYICSNDCIAMSAICIHVAPTVNNIVYMYKCLCHCLLSIFLLLQQKIGKVRSTISSIFIHTLLIVQTTLLSRTVAGLFPRSQQVHTTRAGTVMVAVIRNNKSRAGRPETFAAHVASTIAKSVR